MAKQLAEKVGLHAVQPAAAKQLMKNSVSAHSP
jgi:hypothetical protein